MDVYPAILNIGGSEWIIIGLMVIFLLFGSKKIPEFSRIIGRAMGEYEKARAVTQKGITESFKLGYDEYRGPRIEGPVSTEREKLEKVALSLGIEAGTKSDAELRRLIFARINDDSESN